MDTCVKRPDWFYLATRQETREWLLQRERASVAPSIVPEAPEEKLRAERKRNHSH
jgi:hypothetical protein